MIIICIKLKGPTSKMLHTRFQGHWPSGSGKGFIGFTTYVRGGHLGFLKETFVHLP